MLLAVFETAKCGIYAIDDVDTLADDKGEVP